MNIAIFIILALLMIPKKKEFVGIKKDIEKLKSLKHTKKTFTYKRNYIYAFNEYSPENILAMILRIVAIIILVDAFFIGLPTPLIMITYFIYYIFLFVSAILLLTEFFTRLFFNEAFETIDTYIKRYTQLIVYTLLSFFFMFFVENPVKDFFLLQFSFEVYLMEFWFLLTHVLLFLAFSFPCFLYNLIKLNNKKKKEIEDTKATILNHFASLRFQLIIIYILSSVFLITLYSNFFFLNILPDNADVESIYLKSFELYSSSIVILTVGFAIKKIKSSQVSIK